MNPRPSGAGPVPPAHVEVHAEEVERSRDRREVPGLQRVAEPRAAVVEQGLDVGRVPGAEQGIEEPAVRVAVAKLGGAPVLLRVAVRRGHLEIERDPDPARQTQRTVDLHRSGVSEQHVVRGADGLPKVGVAGRMAAGLVADECRHPRLVQRHPLRDAVAQRAEHGGCVVGEALGGLPGGPASEPRLQRLRQVPVVQRHDRRDVALEQLVDEPCVEAEAALVSRPATLREDPRPGDAEAIRLEPELLHQVEVLRPAVVVVAGNVPGVAVLGHAGRVTEAVPDRLAAAVLVDGALDLVRGRGGPPQEISRERHGGGSPRDVGLRLGRPTIARSERVRRAWRRSRAQFGPRLYLREQHAPRSRRSRTLLRPACGCPGRGLRGAVRTRGPRRRPDAGCRTCHPVERGRTGPRNGRTGCSRTGRARHVAEPDRRAADAFAGTHARGRRGGARPNPRSRTARTR